MRKWGLYRMVPKFWHLFLGMGMFFMLFHLEVIDLIILLFWLVASKPSNGWLSLLDFGNDILLRLY